MNIKKIVKTLGPGIMFASTAIGVSHLVQSTRAGADYQFALLWAIVIANVLKYPFFQYGSRYANSTGKSILHGYKEKGHWILWVYFILSLASMFTVASAVTFVTAGLFSHLFNLSVSVGLVSLGMLVFCAIILISGNFNVLDNLLKIIGIVLFISTVGAYIMALVHGPIPVAAGFVPKQVYDAEGQMFMIALMGWMPTAVDLSTWNSIWTVEKMKSSDEPITMKETLFDFNFGYWVSAVLSICFLTLGAYLMYGSGEEFSNNATQFAGQVVNLFTMALGEWSYPIIAASAFSVMFSTTITVLDGYGRAMSETIQLIFIKTFNSYKVWLVLLTIGSYLVISMFLSEMKTLVDIATIISFVIAPVIAIINFKVIQSDEVKKEHRITAFMKWLSYAGIVYLIGFSVYFLILFFTNA